LRRVVTPEVNAISTVLMAVSVIFVAMFFVLTGRKN
jgi:ABC-type spermidine/putrescine transport system permease subunit II